ncbi:MAG: RNA polymerase sigma factor [Solirubrobacterales bacterium]
MPPPEQLASRILLNPMLRLQPDRRLVALVREGYEGAFEEIVRRYRRPLDRFAAAIVGARSEDVTQDAFSKALLALRGAESEIELRPWLYRIVRNTALNDLRDSPPPTEQLAESLRGGESAAATAERRAELAELVQRLRALPEPQRAAIVMRELEGLSHEEIAAALGVSGGAARQAIYRARAALRDGLGALLPLPLLRTLLDHFGEAGGGVAASVGAASAAGAGAAASGTLGGLGAGGALKIGAATILLAGGVGAGSAIKHHDGRSPQTAAAASPRESPAATAGSNGGPAPLADGAAVAPPTSAPAAARPAPTAARATAAGAAAAAARAAARAPAPAPPPAAARERQPARRTETAPTPARADRAKTITAARARAAAGTAARKGPATRAAARTGPATAAATTRARSRAAAARSAPPAATARARAAARTRCRRPNRRPRPRPKRARRTAAAREAARDRRAPPIRAPAREPNNRPPNSPNPAHLRDPRLRPGLKRRWPT